MYQHRDEQERGPEVGLLDDQHDGTATPATIMISVVLPTGCAQREVTPTPS
jgi:hypothetical protein